MTTQDIVGEYRIDVETGGYCSFDVQLTNSPHEHDYYEICLVLSGHGVYYHGGHSYRLEPGTVFLAVPGVVHEITSFETKDLYLYFINVTIQRLDASVDTGDGALVRAFLSGPLVARPGFESLSGYAEIIEAARPADWNLRAQSLRLFALELMASLCQESSPNSTDQTPSDIAIALKFISLNLDRSLRVSEIAQHLAISERTLRRRFQQWFGASIVEEINHRRMRRAAHRLLMGFSAGEVAEFSGIADPAQFSRCFKKTMGKSPKEFQKTYRPGALSKQTRSA